MSAKSSKRREEERKGGELEEKRDVRENETRENLRNVPSTLDR